MRLVLIVVMLSSSVLAHAQKEVSTLAIEGVYNGKNLIIKNSFGPEGKGFCVIETKVNGKVTTDEINATIFQINLDKCKLKKGDNVRAEIIYQSACTPYISPLLMNPGALPKNINEKISKIVIDGKFKWSNLFLSNPKIDANSFSVSEIKVNNKAISVNLKSDVIEINLMALGMQKAEPIKDGQELIIEIIYLNGFDPILINPEAVQ